jgi:hypothetical protein
MGRIEQEIQEAIDSNAQGFAGGWISSLALDKLLKEQRMDVALPRARRREVLQSLGYEHHPALRNGRSTVALPGIIDRPVFFITTNHAARRLISGAEIMKAYLTAQMPGAAPVYGIVTGERAS